MSASGGDAPVIAREPGDRAPAPGRLRAVQQFVNTLDREAGRDSLGSPSALRDWFVHWTTWPGRSLPTADEHRRALVIREGIRSLAGPAVVAAPPELEQTVDDLALHLAVGEAGLTLRGRDRVGMALEPLLTAVHTAVADGSWARMKVCSRDTCAWLYYDSSRNSSSRWCATDICGSREKARRAYRRGRT